MGYTLFGINFEVRQDRKAYLCRGVDTITRGLTYDQCRDLCQRMWSYELDFDEEGHAWERHFMTAVVPDGREVPTRESIDLAAFRQYEQANRDLTRA